jgi:glycosyltransferase involved in cell wall biosynthesis
LITGDSEIFALQKDSPILRERISFTGYMEDADLPAIYNCASLLVFPSLYEGFGLPPLEAMACGCPVVASNIASITEICGDAVSYVDPNDIENIADGMRNLLTDEILRQKIITRGYEKVKQFTWGKSAEEHIRVIEEVLYS